MLKFLRYPWCFLFCCWGFAQAEVISESKKAEILSQLKVQKSVLEKAKMYRNTLTKFNAWLLFGTVVIALVTFGVALYLEEGDIEAVFYFPLPLAINLCCWSSMIARYIFMAMKTPPNAISKKYLKGLISAQIIAVDLHLLMHVLLIAITLETKNNHKAKPTYEKGYCFWFQGVLWGGAVAFLFAMVMSVPVPALSWIGFCNRHKGSLIAPTAMASSPAKGISPKKRRG